MQEKRRNKVACNDFACGVIARAPNQLVIDEVVHFERRHKERNIVRPNIICDSALPIVMRKFLLQPLIGGDFAAAFTALELFGWDQELSSFCPPGVVGLSKAARHNFMVQLIAKLGSRATGCAAFFEKSNEMRDTDFQTRSRIPFTRLTSV